MSAGKSLLRELEDENEAQKRTISGLCDEAKTLNQQLREREKSTEQLSAKLAIISARTTLTSNLNSARERLHEVEASHSVRTRVFRALDTLGLHCRLLPPYRTSVVSCRRKQDSQTTAVPRSPRSKDF